MKLSNLKNIIKEVLICLPESEEDESVLGFDEQDYYTELVRKNKWKQLTRIDELEALQYIHKILIPIVVNRWNNSPQLQAYEITEDEVRQHLKKINHYKASVYDYEQDNTISDYIVYSCRVNWTEKVYTINGLPILIRFTIKKDTTTGKGLVVIVFENMFNIHTEYKVGTFGDNIFARIIRENKQQLTEIEDQYGSRRPTISKVEEQHALQLILKKLVPIAIGKYNLQAITRWAIPQISKEEALRSFKKVGTKLFTNGQQIDYSIQVSNKAPSIDFRMKKLAFRKSAGDSCNKIVFDISYYDFLTEPGWGDLAWINYNIEDIVNNPKINFGGSLLKENVNRTISKLDDVMGMNYIEKILIPTVSKHWNEIIKSYGSKYSFLHITNEQILSKFRKVGQARHSEKDETTTDVIRFDSIVRLSTHHNKIISVVFMFELYKDIISGKLVADYTVPPTVPAGGETVRYIVGDIPNYE